MSTCQDQEETSMGQGLKRLNGLSKTNSMVYWLKERTNHYNLTQTPAHFSLNTEK